MFLIRENALKILVDIYQNCDSSLQVKNFNLAKYGNDVSNNTKSIRYLTQTGYIERVSEVVPKCVTITAKGIDKAEDIILQKEE